MRLLDRREAHGDFERIIEVHRVSISHRTRDKNSSSPISLLFSPPRPFFIVNDQRPPRNGSIETASGPCRGPNFDLKFLRGSFIQKYMYTYICNRCIRSAIFVCPILSIFCFFTGIGVGAEGYILVPKCKNCERAFFSCEPIFVESTITSLTDTLLYVYTGSCIAYTRSIHVTYTYVYI